ncbi:hypothetical protein KCU64_g8812, partial [Aureobasidium melanogenum]
MDKHQDRQPHGMAYILPSMASNNSLSINDSTEPWNSRLTYAPSVAAHLSGRPLEPWAQCLGYTPSVATHQCRPFYVNPAAVEWMYRLPVEEDEPFELGPIPTDLALDENDNLEVVHFFTTCISPWSEHSKNVNKLLADARLWHRHLPRHRDAIRDGTYLFRHDDLRPMPFNLLVEVEDDGVKTLKLCQHPLLGISRHTRRAFLDDWYLHNDFKVVFDTALAARNRSHFEKAMKLLSPHHKTLLFTPASATISPRLHVELQMP